MLDRRTPCSAQGPRRVSRPHRAAVTAERRTADLGATQGTVPQQDSSTGHRHGGTGARVRQKPDYFICIIFGDKEERAAVQKDQPFEDYS